MPATTSASRTARASAAAPGRIAVDADGVGLDGDARAVERRSRVCRDAIPTARAGDLGRVGDNRARRAARQSGCRRGDSRDPQTPRMPRAGRARSPAAMSCEPDRPNSTSDASTPRTARAMASAMAGVARRHVVERPVRLHVAEPDPLSGGDARQRPHLVGDQVLHLGRAQVHLPPSKSRQVLEARMRADRDAVTAGQLDRAAHHPGSPAWKPQAIFAEETKGHHPLVVPVAVGPVGLPDVGVQVNPHDHPGCPTADTLVILPSWLADAAWPIWPDFGRFRVGMPVAY